MNNTGSVFIKDYPINSLNMNAGKRLGLVGLLGMLQDVTSEHAMRLGFGYEDSMTKGFFWVLVRQKVRMDRWPHWNDIVVIKTWTIPVFGIYAVREYELFVNDIKIGDCSTTWMILDSESRKPKKIENSDNLFRPRTDYSVGYAAEKVNLPQEMNAAKTFEVRISDLDMNNHVNNIKYSQWILDSIPFSYHQKYSLGEYEINFSGETFLEDEIETFCNIAHMKIGEPSELFFKGNRVADGKTVFTARLVAREVK